MDKFCLLNSAHLSMLSASNLSMTVNLSLKMLPLIPSDKLTQEACQAVDPTMSSDHMVEDLTRLEVSTFSLLTAPTVTLIAI